MRLSYLFLWVGGRHSCGTVRVHTGRRCVTPGHLLLAVSQGVKNACEMFFSAVVFSAFQTLGA